MVASRPVVPVSMPVSSGCGGMGCGGGAAGFSMGRGAMGMGMPMMNGGAHDGGMPMMMNGGGAAGYSMGGGAMGMGMGGGMNGGMHGGYHMGMGMHEFEEPEMEFDAEDMMGMHGGMHGGYNMGMHDGGSMMGMNGGSMMGMNGGGSMMNGGGMNAGQTVVPVTGVRYKLKPYTYKYEYPVWKPDSHMAFQHTNYNDPCANGCSSSNPHCCHKEVTYVPKTVPKVVEETISVPVEVDVPNVSCGCHASRPHCCGGNRRPVSSRSSGCSCHASAPHCCNLSSPKWGYESPSRNQHYGAVGYPVFQF